MTRCLVIAALCVGVAADARANPSLDKARKQLADLYFEEAGQSLQAALRAGTSDRAETAEIYRLMGEVAATLENTEEAQQHFKCALSIDPDGKLPAGSSPKLSKPFAAAKRALGSKAIDIRHAIKRRSPPTLLLVVSSDPCSLVSGTSAQVWDRRGKEKKGRGKSKKASRAGEYEIELAAGSASAVLFAVDAHGNRVGVIGTTQDPIVLDEGGEAPEEGGEEPPREQPEPEPEPEKARVEIESSPTPAEDPEPSGGFRGYWLIAGAATVVLVGVGTYTGLSARDKIQEIEGLSAGSDSVDYGSDVKPLEDEARRDALITNVSFAAAGVGAVATVLLYLTSRDEPEPERRRALITPALGRDSVGVAATLPF